MSIKMMQGSLRGACRHHCSAFRSMQGASVRHASGNAGYNQPSGHLFGEKPSPNGEKRVKQDWEDLWMYGMFGGMAFGAVLLFYKPDTSIKSWAMVEAKKRLEGGEGVWKYEPSPNSGHPKGI